MRVISPYSPLTPIAVDGPITAISPIRSASPVYFDSPRTDWWDMVSTQLGDRVANMLKDGLYGRATSTPSFVLQDQAMQSDILRFTLENEIRHARMQQLSYHEEAAKQDQQIRLAQLYAKSDMWLEEKARIKAQEEAELLALERSQSIHESDTNPTQRQEESTPKDKQIEDSEKKDDEDSQSAYMGKDGEPLSHEEVRLVNELKAIDINVKNHEVAHLGAAGGLARGGANYAYTEGPDGVLYATEGEVSIDTSETGDPKKDVQKAQQIRAAALAPSDPSPQDYRVAASATMMEMKAQMRLAQETFEELKKDQGVKVYRENIDNIQKAQSAPPIFRAIA